MATYYFSAGTRGFYTESVHGEDMPTDVVPVTEEQWRALLDAQSTGMEIRGGESGRPFAAQPENAI
jgi:hypothetical protein